MKFLILGDVHGCWDDLNVTIAKAIREHSDITHIIQVGDWGYGFPGMKPFKYSKGFLTDHEMNLVTQLPHYFLDGNHDNHELLEQDNGSWQPGWQYMPRGSVLEIEQYRMIFCGGASSIDKHLRVEGKTWWSGESITYSQIQKTLNTVDGPIDAIFSHEHPSSIPYSDVRYKGKLFGKSDKDMLEVLKQNYKPKWQFFGHHHEGDFGEVDGTEWTCCPIIEARTYTIWDGEIVRREWS